MYRALVVKELRDLRGVLAVAAFVGLLMTAILSGTLLPPSMHLDPSDGLVRFTSRAEVLWITVFATGTALALGYWQSAVEIQRGTVPYLFHLPLSRNRIVLTKLATGLSLQALLVAIPILMLGVLAGWPGLWPAPFAWGWTWNCWSFGCSTLLVYLAASASGWLEARWFGLRLAPLLAVGPAFSFSVMTMFSAWWLVFLLPYAGLLIVATLRAAEARDY